MEDQRLKDMEAEIKIRSLVYEFKKNGSSSISILDLLSETGLSPEQIDSIMKKLENEGLVSEDE